CLSLFYAMAEQMPPIPTAPRFTETTVASHQSPTEAEELWLDVEDPPLGGRIDRAHEGCLIDFKTGEPNDAHAEQIIFYALLWWLRFGEAPKRLQLFYPHNGASKEIPVPTDAALETLAESYRQEVCDANAALRSRIVQARPAVTTCESCPVRQLCDEYWKDR